MTGEPITTIVGNLAGDPELRFTPSGAAVVNFTIASTPRKFDRNTNEWVDEETLWMRCSWWREAAENTAESLHKGDRVIATGRLKSRSWDDKDTGAKRTVVELEVDEVGPSLRYATAKVTKAQRSGGQGQGQQQQAGQDPWSTGWQGAPQQGGQAPAWAGPQQGAPQGPPQQGGPQGPAQGQPQQGGWQGGQPYDQPPY